jgi:hypothetical protein
MAQPEADYEIDFDEDEQRILDDARAEAREAAAAKAREAVAELDAEARKNELDRQLALVQARGAKADGGEIDVAVVEGSVAEADDGSTVEFMGKRFRMAEKIGLMPLLKFASASDMSTEDPRALAAMYSMLKDCIYPGVPACGNCAECEAGKDTQCKEYDRSDWPSFEDHAIETKADADELFAVISQVMEIISGRPTQPPAGSSPTRRGTRRGSTGSTSGGRGRGSRR